jgi:hypothetical protein
MLTLQRYLLALVVAGLLLVLTALLLLLHTLQHRIYPPTHGQVLDLELSMPTPQHYQQA